jgi:hypothetical protein
MVDKPDLGKYQPSCNLAHGLVNKLSVIIGYCDLLKDEAPEDSECQKRLDAVRAITKDMAAELLRHQCDIEVIMREARKKPPLSGKPISVSKQPEYLPPSITKNALAFRSGQVCVM